MNLVATTTSIDRDISRGKYARTHISFPRSVRTSIDDLVLDSPLTAFYATGNELRPRLRSHSHDQKVVDSSESDPASLIESRQPFQYPYPEGEDTFPHRDDSASCSSWHTAHQSNTTDDAGEAPSATLALTALHHDSALREAGFDTSCLDTLDEQLLRCPMDCFTEMCWAAAVEDEEPHVVALDVDIVDMGMGFNKSGDVLAKQTADTCPSKGARGIRIPPPPASSPVSVIPLSKSCSGPYDPVEPVWDAGPRKDWLENDYPPVLHEKKVLSITPPKHEIHHIDIGLSSPPSPGSLKGIPAIASVTAQRASLLAASEVRIVYSNPNDSVHYFPVPRDRTRELEKRERKERLSSHELRSKKLLQSPRSPPSHTQSPTTPRSARPQTKIKSRAKKRQRLPPPISSPTLLPSSETSSNPKLCGPQGIPIQIPTFPMEPAYSPSTPPPTFSAPYDEGSTPPTPTTPRSGATLRMISNAYSTLTGRRRTKSTV